MALQGIKVVEFAGLAPGPFCGMILADFGAEVVRIDKPNGNHTLIPDILARGKKSLAINLKSPTSKKIILKLCDQADVLIEPFRPGVMEKNGLGPDVICKRNPRIIYARLTGFGQHGIYAPRAGHDINYLAVSGVLSMLGRAHEKPMPPLNILADFAGGGLLCACGILLALFERMKSGKGQTIDCAMVDGVLYLASFNYIGKDLLFGNKPRGYNFFDGGVPFYEVYKTKDNKYLAVGALEPQFYHALLKVLGLDPAEFPQWERSVWPKLSRKLTEVFSEKTQEEWCQVFKDEDLCVTPVVDVHSLHHDNYITKERRSLLQKGERIEPAPAPKLSRTPGMKKFKTLTSSAILITDGVRHCVIGRKE